jgi:hypothetical protein
VSRLGKTGSNQSARGRQESFLLGLAVFFWLSLLRAGIRHSLAKRQSTSVGSHAARDRSQQTAADRHQPASRTGAVSAKTIQCLTTEMGPQTLAHTGSQACRHATRSSTKVMRLILVHLGN